MRRPVFKATIVGSENVKRTGRIRSPDSFRIRIYEGGEVVITTRGRLDDLSQFPEEVKYSPFTYDAIVERLSELAGESRQAMKTTKTKRRAGSR